MIRSTFIIVLIWNFYPCCRNAAVQISGWDFLYRNHQFCMALDSSRCTGSFVLMVNRWFVAGDNVHITWNTAYDLIHVIMNWNRYGSFHGVIQNHTQIVMFFPLFWWLRILFQIPFLRTKLPDTREILRLSACAMGVIYDHVAHMNHMYLKQSSIWLAGSLSE